MDRKTFIKSIAVIGASPAFAAGVPLKDADGKNKTKSESFGGGFVPSARIFKTGRAKLTLRPPASCHRFRFQYSTATQRGTESRTLSRGRGISPQNIAKKTGRLPLTPTLKKSAAILSSLRIKSAAGTKASSLPSPSTRLGRTSTRLGRSKVTATYTPQIRTGKTRRRKSPCAATKSGSTTRQYPTTASIPLPRT